jgi:rare lipoprotein A
MRHELIVVGCLGLVLVACGEKRIVRAAVPARPIAAEPGIAAEPTATAGIASGAGIAPVAGAGAETSLVAEVGIASWYGHPYHGRTAASGEIYDMEQFTAAHRTLPFGTWVRVVNLGNTKIVDVRINDRGPFIESRIIDLSHAAARAIEMIGPGTARVRLDIIATPAAAISALYGVQVGAFQNRANAERLRTEMEIHHGSARLIFRASEPALWRVVVGQETTIQAANALASRILGRPRGIIEHAFVVRQDVSQPARMRASRETL